MYICDPPESNPPSQIIPPFNKCILYATLQEYTSPSLNIPPFSTTLCDPPRIYPSLSEYTPFSTYVYVRPSQNISLPPSQNTPPFSTTKCDLPRIYPTFNSYNIMRCSQNLPLPPFSTTIYNPPRIYPSLPEYTHFSTTILLYDAPRIYPSLHLSQNITPPPFQQLYATLTKITPPSENTPLF